MAFDIPLDADQPSDLGFFSSLVTAPISGTVMWILRGGKNEEPDETKDSQIETELENTATDGFHIKSFEQRKSIVQDVIKHIPDVSESDVSNFDDDAECSSSGYETEKEKNNKSQDGGGISSNQFRHRAFNYQVKRTSWSDESGQSLVEYLNDTTLHEPQPDIRPVKSVMKKSKSIYSKHKNIVNAQDLDSTNKNISSEQQYIPSGITSSGGGIVMPSGGGMKTSSSGGAHVSPQWGWYISTTPPTPEKYPNTKNTPSKVRSTFKETDISLELQNTSITDDSKRTLEPPAPVFTKGVKGVGRTHMEWSGIPL